LVRKFASEQAENSGELPNRDTSSATAYAVAMNDHALADPMAWRPLKAPSLVEFEVIATEAFRRLPQRFRDKCEGVVIRVEDYPTDEVLDSVGVQSELDLMGLFHGVGLPFQADSAPQQMPNMVWLYRVPILLYWSEHEETLGHIITHVLVHEIGHHFGLSDDDMMAIEEAAG
jgi:predicted Zn-dependent protease with MMP-like domain